MNIANERRLAAKANALGESACAHSLPDLADLARSASPLVRRLAASAVGKLAGIVDSAASVDLLRPLLADAHPQVRQYAAKALGAFGADAEAALPDLRDLYANPTEKDYVKRSVLTAGKTIREACRIAAAQAVHVCRRCGATVSADEYARAQKAFQRTFCDKCFDEVFLDRRPDFYLPEFDVYIEYWGMDTADYKIGMLKKQKLYQQEGKRVVSLHFRDKPRLREILEEKIVLLRGSSA